MKKTTTHTIAELRKLFPFITSEELQHRRNNNKYKTDRGFLGYLERINNNYRAMVEQPHPERIEIKIEWVKSRTWGANPHAEAWVKTAGGHYEKYTATASGCGYDKLSTVVACIMNDCARGLLYSKRRNKARAPYGVYFNRWSPCFFDGGIGIRSYRNITEFLGGKMTHEGGRTWDWIVFEFGKNSRKA